jgi:hypothetical protein
MVGVMTAYVAWNNGTAMQCYVEILPGRVAGRTKCFECDGTGRWTFTPEGRADACPECKSTGAS